MESMNYVSKEKKSSTLKQHRPKKIFLVWAPASIRAENISRRLEAQLYLISYKFKNKIYFPIKYPLLFAKTFIILKKEKPEIIICQNPPILTAMSVMICSYLLGINIIVVIDSHTGAFCRPWSYIKMLNKIVMKRAAMTIVTNVELQDDVLCQYGIRSIVLEDPIPDFELIISEEG
jgi:hypothetical protein